MNALTVTEMPAPTQSGDTYRALNAALYFFDQDGKYQLHQDREAARAFFLEEVNRKTMFFHNLEERLSYLRENGYYETGVLDQYSFEFIQELTDAAYARRFRFQSLLAAVKFYGSYAMTTFDGESYLERFEDRVVMASLYLARGDEDTARQLMDELIGGRLALATPTFLNAGKQNRGAMVSCFLLRTEDDFESIFDRIRSSAQLSKRGGGVAVLLTNIREQGAPIKRIEGQSRGILPVMKLLEDTFSYADQMGQRQGAGAAYLSVHHPDILRFLDTKRENADEKIRVKTLNLGVMMTDIAFEAAQKDKDLYLFSPYDVEQVYGVPMSDIAISEKYDEMVGDSRIKKSKISARGLLRTIAQVQLESGYPYMIFEDTVNRESQIAGRINMSNLCTEIFQVNEPASYKPDGSYLTPGKDISCNLASMNIALAMDGGDISRTVETAVRALSAVSDMSDIDSVPSVAAGNRRSHAIGLGQMNLAGYLGREHVHYGSEEGIDFTNIYFYTVAYHAIRASNLLAIERGETFDGFESSTYADGSYFTKYTTKSWKPVTERVAQLFKAAGIRIPTKADWARLRDSVAAHGIYNQNLQAVPPTGSISYINNSTASIAPIAARVEIRKEGKTGRLYYAAPHMTDENKEFFLDAYEIGYEKLIATYAAAGQHVDQGLSMNVYFVGSVTTRELTKMQGLAWKSGIKSIYYVRQRDEFVEGSDLEGCVACAL